ncbi:MAG: antibiotic biosynthesis monooxygenase, partial [Candidatus Eremiobacteraeota bacterium]|nr:antibiotic biosynthesis monooxygenase [Candidatus Eremiobacteraeota bacterium]
MIARVWRGHVPTRERADRYADFVTGHVLPELRHIAGHRGAYVLRRDDGEAAEFVALTLWDSVDAIRAF